MPIVDSSQRTPGVRTGPAPLVAPRLGDEVETGPGGGFVAAGVGWREPADDGMELPAE